MSVPPELLQAARAEFSRNGYKATSIAAIANRAGIAVGSVYLHYSSKYELFRDVYKKPIINIDNNSCPQLIGQTPRKHFQNFSPTFLAI